MRRTHQNIGKMCVTQRARRFLHRIASKLTTCLRARFFRQFTIALRRLVNSFLAWFVDLTLGRCPGPTRILIKCAQPSARDTHYYIASKPTQRYMPQRVGIVGINLRPYMKRMP